MISIIAKNLLKLPLIERAQTVAYFCHLGQTRKYTHLPYITHPFRVAKIIQDLFYTEAYVAAAYLHDTIEDCHISAEEFAEIFNPDICKLVVELTNVYTKDKCPSFNRKKRKELELTRIAGISPQAKVIKLADRLDNLLEIEGAEPDFKLLYCDETEVLLSVIGNAYHELAARIRIKINEIREEASL